MQIYENSYFNIRVTLPPGWHKRYRFESGVAGGSQYQAADDDLPTAGDDYRTLLFAWRRLEGSPSILGSRFCIVAHRRFDGYDLFRETKDKQDVIEIKSATLDVLGREAQAIEMLQNGGDFTMATKIFAWEEKPELWVSVFCDGDSPQSFQASEEVLASMSRIAVCDRKSTY